MLLILSFNLFRFSQVGLIARRIGYTYSPLQVSENNGSSVFVELLRGRDIVILGGTVPQVWMEPMVLEEVVDLLDLKDVPLGPVGPAGHVGSGDTGPAGPPGHPAPRDMLD